MSANPGGPDDSSAGADRARRLREDGKAEIQRILDAVGQLPVRRVSTSSQLEDVQKPSRRWRDLWKWPWTRKKAPTSLAEIVLADHHLDVQLKSMVARGALWAMIGQLVVADTVFVLYAGLGRGWNVPGEVMLGWLTATVVEIIGVVVVVARYLFPKDGHQWSREQAPFSSTAPALDDPADD
jgi:hypothetical protein